VILLAHEEDASAATIRARMTDEVAERVRRYRAHLDTLAEEKIEGQMNRGGDIHDEASAKGE
jgi:hypothetical protein